MLLLGGGQLSADGDGIDLSGSLRASTCRSSRSGWSTRRAIRADVAHNNKLLAWGYVGSEP
jgi:hypothetical protein